MAWNPMENRSDHISHGSFLERGRRELNPAQFEAVSTTEGPVLVLAGAGSGKTRVLTYRIAHLIYDKQIPLPSILAMTFSNKAAREMHDRVKVLLGLENRPDIRLPWISTFHSVSARILRMHGKRLGFEPHFAIYDTADQISLLKGCYEGLSFSGNELDPDTAHHKIGEWKNQGKLPQDLENSLVSTHDERCWQVYKNYQAALLKAQAMDFDDLLLQAYRLFHNHADLRGLFRNQWRYVLIDEFQDTNDIQYKLLTEILNADRNLCVVGDDDQSIYGWRGARIENILEFDKTFEGCKVVKLEQNYRSTGNILKAADSVISKNEMRHQKTLWTDSGEGEKVRLAVLEDDRAEAQFVISEIRKRLQSGFPAKEIAVFYRINSLSRGFEEECLKQRVPYKIVGGFRFYERKEIKDILAYLKLLLNPADLIAFRRTVNTPLRGIGKSSIEKIEELVLRSQMNVADWLINPESPNPCTGKAKNGLENYRNFLRSGRQLLEGNQETSLVDLFIDTFKLTGYMSALESEADEESRDRIDNLQELLSAVQEFEETWQPHEDFGDQETTNPLRRKLTDFLERASLIADTDALDGIEEDQVTFMSLHSAKGLEFKVCFVTAMEEGLFPSARSMDSYQRTEEERRLCYVGMTRARERLYLTRTLRRRTFGSINFCMPSRFLADLPKTILETVRDESDYLEPAYGFGNRPGGRIESDWHVDPAPNQYPLRRPKKPVNEFSQESGFDDFDQTPAKESSFKKGDRVKHPSFGEGIVQKIEWLGEEECLAIVFAGKGMKKVLSRFVARR